MPFFTFVKGFSYVYGASAVWVSDILSLVASICWIYVVKRVEYLWKV